MTHINNKAEFYQMSRALALGNRLDQWGWDEFLIRYNTGKPALPKLVGVRHVGKSYTKSGNSQLMTPQEAYRLGKSISNTAALKFDTAAPHDRQTIQGEVCATEQGLYVRYSFEKIHQRRLWELDQTGIIKHATGLKASCLLQTFMDAYSWEMLQVILSCQLDEGTHASYGINLTYPIVEFACFDCVVGVLEWNTLFWECRTRY
jgi:hypothetical protein